MKKCVIILLFAVSLLAASAQICPSRFEIKQAHVTGKVNKYKLKLLLTNYSHNLNIFAFEVTKPSSARWAIVDKARNRYFTADGYGKNILAGWEGRSDEEREQDLYQHCDVQSKIQDDKLLAIEALGTPDCRYFPCGEYIEVGEFAIDMSDCEDGEYYLWTTTKCTFGFYGGPEGDCSMPGEVFSFTLYKQGDLVSVRWDFPLDDYDGIEEVEKSRSVASVRYYNLAGVESTEPFDGVSIKVTTYTDGTRTSEKVVH